MSETTFEAAFRIAEANGAVKQQQGQEDEAFLFSILKALSTCSQDQWDRLGVSCPDAHAWYNEGAVANKNSEPIPFPTGFKTKILQKLTPDPPRPKQQTQAKPAVQKPVIVMQKPERKERDTRSKNSGILDAVRKTVILNQDWPAKRVHEYLLNNGFPAASQALVAVNVGDIKRVILMVRELGYWYEHGGKR